MADPSIEAADPTIRQRIETLSRAVDALRDDLFDVREERDQLRERVAELEQRHEAQSTRMDRLDERTDLLDFVRHADQASGKQRAIALLLHLEAAARKNAEDGNGPFAGRPKARITPDQADEALHHPDLDRSNIYKDMRRAQRLIGDTEICQYVSKGYGETFLELDLTTLRERETTVTSAISEDLTGGSNL